jgi:hypothetical protein
MSKIKKRNNKNNTVKIKDADKEKRLASNKNIIHRKIQLWRE